MATASFVGLRLALVVAAGLALTASGQALGDTRAVAHPKLASGHSSWQPPQMIPAASIASPPGIAVDARGDAIAVWSDATFSAGSVIYPVRAAVRPSGGAWQPPENLSTGIDAQVAMDPAGEAVAVWQASGTPFAVTAAVRTATGDWLPPQALSAEIGAGPAVAIDARGDAIVTWARTNLRRSTAASTGGIQVAVRSAGGPFATAQAISTSENAFYPRIVVNARGDALVAWEVDTPRGCIVRAASGRVGGRWSEPRTLSDRRAGCPAGQQVAIDQRGDAIVVWVAQRGRTIYVETADRASSGRWRARRAIGSSPIIDSATVAMDARGDALVAWSDESDRIDVAARYAGSTWRAPRRLPHASGLVPQVAMTAHGEALIALQDGDAITASARSTTGPWEKPQRISRQRPKTMPLIALDGRDDALVAWQTSLGIETAWRAAPFY